VLFWVWPPTSSSRPCTRRFTPAITVTDVNDDERSWSTPGTPAFARVTHNYEEILGASDLV